MAVETNIPVTVSLEAAERTGELGMQSQLEQMLDHARQTIRGLQSLRVVLAPPFDTGEESSVIIEAMIDSHPSIVDDRTDWDWGTWQVENFPPQVCQYLHLTTIYGNSHGR